MKQMHRRPDFFVKQNALQVRLIKQSAPQARRIKQNAPQARFFD